MTDMVKFCTIQIPDLDKMFADLDAMRPTKPSAIAELDRWATQFEEYFALGFSISADIICHDLFREICDADRVRIQEILEDVVSKNVNKFMDEWSAKNQSLDKPKNADKSHG